MFSIIEKVMINLDVDGNFAHKFRKTPEAASPVLRGGRPFSHGFRDNNIYKLIQTISECTIETGDKTGYQNLDSLQGFLNTGCMSTNHTSAPRT